jgi:hypothetical protein
VIKSGRGAEESCVIPSSALSCSYYQEEKDCVNDVNGDVCVWNASENICSIFVLYEEKKLSGRVIVIIIVIAGILFIFSMILVLVVGCVMKKTRKSGKKRVKIIPVYPEEESY